MSLSLKNVFAPTVLAFLVAASDLQARVSGSAVSSNHGVVPELSAAANSNSGPVRSQLSFYPSGNVRSATTIDEATGLFSGSHRVWTRFGKLRIEGQHENGLRSGKWKLFNALDGGLEETMEYKHGEIHGLAQKFGRQKNRSGDVRVVVTCTDYFLHGKKVTEQAYKNYQLAGKAGEPPSYEAGQP